MKEENHMLTPNWEARAQAAEATLEAMTADRDAWRDQSKQWEERWRQATEESEAVELTAKVADSQSSRLKRSVKAIVDALREKIGYQRTSNIESKLERDHKLQECYDSLVVQYPQHHHKSPAHREHGQSDQLAKMLGKEYESRCDTDLNMNWKHLKKNYLPKLRKNSSV